jgi:hypothetical protein
MTNEEETKSLAITRLRAQLTEVHSDLLTIHKALLDYERGRYEKVKGPIKNSGEYLHLVIGDPWFAWLRQASGLIAQVDEFISTKKPVEASEGEALLGESRAMFTPSDEGGAFQRAYMTAIRESPDVALGHAHWKLTLLRFDR